MNTEIIYLNIEGVSVECSCTYTHHNAINGGNSEESWPDWYEIISLMIVENDGDIEGLINMFEKRIIELVKISEKESKYGI